MTEEERQEYLKAYYKNEYDANKHMAFALLFTAILLFIIWILYLIPPIFRLTRETRLITCIGLPIVCLVLLSPLLGIKRKRGEKPGFKYFVLSTFIFVILILNVIMPKHAILGWAICILLTNHYYNPKVGRIIFIATLGAMFVGIFLGMFFGEYDPNLLMGQLDENTGLIHNIIEPDITFPDTPSGRYQYIHYLYENGYNRYLAALAYYFAPRAVALLILFFGSNALNKRTYNLLVAEIRVSNKQTNQAKELEIARDIQLSELPEAFFSTKDIEVIANLQAAREVGGDFYDYYLLDDKHIAILIGDVSGKGTPAAMFMMQTITCFKNFSRPEMKPSEIIKAVNKSIYENNAKEMFVTCFLGIIDIETGVMEYANAGHNPPVVGHSKHFQLLKCNPGFVLGGLADAFVVDEEYKLEKGDWVTLYTDGLTEARNAKGEFYGENRLLSLFNCRERDSIIEFHHELNDEIEVFTDGFEQFDDLTTLTLKYKGGQTFYEAANLEAKIENVQVVMQLVDKVCVTPAYSLYKNKLKVVIDELFSNIAKYAYQDGGGEVYVRTAFNKETSTLGLALIDKGVAFNQLEKDSEIIDENYQTRQAGGLGVVLVKQFVDSYQYSRINGKNILLIKKIIK